MCYTNEYYRKVRKIENHPPVIPEPIQQNTNQLPQNAVELNAKPIIVSVIFMILLTFSIGMLFVWINISIWLEEQVRPNGVNALGSILAFVFLVPPFLVLMPLTISLIKRLQSRGIDTSRTIRIGSLIIIAVLVILAIIFIAPKIADAIRLLFLIGSNKGYSY
jgi:uncharacterized BrkB/YihY/UPF0761 family membrane protein